jgi:hypothetical protein
MAVSQYLRPGSLLDSLTSCFTPGAVKGASSLIGAPESSARIALHSAAPAVLGAMTGMASTDEDAKSLFRLIQDGGYHALVDEPAALFSGGSITSSITSAGSQLTGRLFGERLTAVTETVAKASGLSLAQATTVLQLVAPLALGVAEKEILSRRLDAPGLRALLLEQKGEFEAALPPKGPQIVAPRPEAASQRRESDLEANLGKWLAVWLIVLLAFCAFLWIRSGTLEGGSGTAGNPAAQRTTAPGQ